LTPHSFTHSLTDTRNRRAAVFDLLNFRRVILSKQVRNGKNINFTHAQFHHNQIAKLYGVMSKVANEPILTNDVPFFSVIVHYI